MEKNYAFIKNDLIVNVAVFDDPTEDTINTFKQIHNVDLILQVDNAFVGGTYDGAKFWSPQPYPSWIKNEELNEWVAPIPYPVIEEGNDEQYVWDEPSTSWLLLPPSN